MIIFWINYCVLEKDIEFFKVGEGLDIGMVIGEVVLSWIDILIVFVLVFNFESFCIFIIL